MQTDKRGTRRWFNDSGQLHRTDGPAVDKAAGTRQWWVADQLHRTDGPAIEHTDGTREWWVAGQLHRTNGPAIEHTNGTRAWWVHHAQVPNPEVLNALYDAGRLEELREVLTAWTPDGPDPERLRDAFGAAVS